MLKVNNLFEMNSFICFIRFFPEVIYSLPVCLCSELSSKLQDTLEMIDESMDVALSKICCHFDNDYYTRIQTAYRLLGKTQVSLQIDYRLLR